jgi:hypothetical protein
LALARFTNGQSAPAISSAISTPDKVESRQGALEFKRAAVATVAKISDV